MSKALSTREISSGLRSVFNEQPISMSETQRCLVSFMHCDRAKRHKIMQSLPDNAKMRQDLERLISKESFSFLRCIQFDGAECDALKFETIKKLTVNQDERPHILSFKTLANGKQTYSLFGDAIEKLQDFTSDAFLRSVYDFDFFEFQKHATNKNTGLQVWKRCSDDEVCNVLNRMKVDKELHTLLLLIFIMAAYYKKFIVSSIKSALQNVCVIDKDSLGIITSYLLTYHTALDQHFESHQEVMHWVVNEAGDASDEWQDILVDILSKDEHYKALYPVQPRQYHTSENVNFVHWKLCAARFGDPDRELLKWRVAESVKHGHLRVFETLVNEYCDDTESYTEILLNAVSREDFDSDWRQRWNPDSAKYKMLKAMDAKKKTLTKNHATKLDEWKLLHAFDKWMYGD